MLYVLCIVDQRRHSSERNEVVAEYVQAFVEPSGEQLTLTWLAWQPASLATLYQMDDCVCEFHHDDVVHVLSSRFDLFKQRPHGGNRRGLGAPNTRIVADAVNDDAVADDHLKLLWKTLSHVHHGPKMYAL